MTKFPESETQPIRELCDKHFGDARQPKRHTLTSRDIACEIFRDHQRGKFLLADGEDQICLSMITVPTPLPQTVKPKDHHTWALAWLHTDIEDFGDFRRSKFWRHFRQVHGLLLMAEHSPAE